MDTAVILRQIYKIARTKSYFDFPIEEQKNFLKSRRKPCDLIDRSYLQYQCQFYFLPLFPRILLNFLSFLAIPFYVCFNYLKRKPHNIVSVDALDDSKGWPNLCMPISLKEEFPNIVEIDYNGNTYLDIEDLLFIWRILCKHPFSSYFLLKAIIKISKYSYLIKRYQPRAFLVKNEFSFTSSLLTNYCRNKKILHIDYQHGDRFFEINCSFFEYDRCYVWDEFYVRLYKELFSSSHFIVETPPSIKIDKSANSNSSCYRDFKYYLGEHNEDELRIISQNMKLLGEKGFLWSVRLHPRFSDRQTVLRYFEDDNIEESTTTIEDSLSNVKYAISAFSTVLYQAFSNGIEAVVDDMVNKNQYNRLKNIHWIMMEKKHRILSEFIKNQ